MGSEQAEPVLGPDAYLRTLPPFDSLDAETFARVIAALEIVYVPAGTRVLRRGGAPSGHLHLVRKGVALLSRDDVAVLEVEPGEWFGLPSVVEDRPPEFDVDAIEDLLVYRLPAALVRELAHVPAFAQQVTQGLASRLRATATEAQAGPMLLPVTPVSTLAWRALVTLPADADVGAIARTMRDEQVSSVVLTGQPRAIVTTRDLRDRVLADGLGPDTPASLIASSPILSIDAATPLAEARATMLEHSQHHLGIERDGDLVGVVTAGDLLRHEATSPLHVQRELASVSRDALPQVPGRFRATVATLVHGGLAPTEVTRSLSLLTDVLVRRAIALAIADLGPPPAAFAWMTLGSDARREQTLVTDQDHALVHDPVDEAGRAWFTALAHDVTDQLERAGLPRCPGGVMAVNWADTSARWQRRFEDWFSHPDVDALYETSIFLDRRVAAGTLDISALDEMARAHRGEGVLLARMAAAAGTSRPPVGPLRRVRSGTDGIDLKKGGINPIVAIARVLAFEAGSTARSTIERIAAAREHGGLGRDQAEELTEAFSFLQQLRLEGQLGAWREGTTPSNRVVLDDLAPTRRRHCKDAFVAVSRIQQTTIQRLGGDEVSR